MSHIYCTTSINCIFFFLFSQLPDFLGGSCTCSTEGGCLRSNKGPWNDSDVMKVGNPSIEVPIVIFSVEFLEQEGDSLKLYVEPVVGNNQFILLCSLYIMRKQHL